MPLPRFRIRTLMIAVAALSAAMGLGIRHRLSVFAARYRVLAEFHAAREAGYRTFLSRLTNPPARLNWVPESRGYDGLSQALVRKPGSKDLLVQWVAPPLGLDPVVKSASAPAMSPGRAKALAVYSKRISYHSSMRRKYEWLAEHPWQSATPDPPSPQ
jgi:hypothetical protein